MVIGLGLMVIGLGYITFLVAFPTSNFGVTLFLIGLNLLSVTINGLAGYHHFRTLTDKSPSVFVGE